MSQTSHKPEKLLHEELVNYRGTGSLLLDFKDYAPFRNDMDHYFEEVYLQPHDMVEVLGTGIVYKKGTMKIMCRGDHTFKVIERVRGLFQKMLFSPMNTLYSALIFTDLSKLDYYSWFVDILAKLVIAKQYIYNLEFVLPAESILSYSKTSLEYIGIPWKKIVVVPSERKVVVEEPWYLESASDEHFVRPRVMQELSNTILNRYALANVEKSIILSKKIHRKNKAMVVSRMPGDPYLVNQKKIDGILHSYGIKTYYIDSYNVEFFIYLFKRIQFLITFSHDLLTNMLWMDKNSTIIELHRGKVQARFFCLASSLNHDYNYDTVDKKGEFGYHWNYKRAQATIRKSLNL